MRNVGRRERVREFEVEKGTKRGVCNLLSLITSTASLQWSIRMWWVHMLLITD
jgi:hypothetical protein